MKPCTLMLVVGLFLGGFLPSYAQRPGCSELEIGTFLTTLPDGFTCAIAAQGILTPRDLTQLPGNLDSFCNAQCGSSLADYLYLKCNNAPFSTALHALCQTSDTQGGRCRLSYPDFIANTTFMRLVSSCAPFSTDASSCPVGCQEALEVFINTTSCCYNVIYDDPVVINTFPDLGLLSTSDVEFFTNTLTSSLFSACDVDPPDACTGESFPGTSYFEVGLCSTAEIDTFFSGRTAACNRAARFLTSDASRRLTDADYAALCTTGCGLALSEFFRDSCRDEFAANGTTFRCLISDGMLGDRCQDTFVSEDIDPVFAAVGATCLTFNPQIPMCPSGCANALQQLRDQVGCCYQSVYNNTRFLEAGVQPDFFDENELNFFTFIGQEALWDTCDVALTQECVGEPFSAAATTFTPSILVVLVALFLAWY